MINIIEKQLDASHIKNLFKKWQMTRNIVVRSAKISTPGVD